MKKITIAIITLIGLVISPAIPSLALNYGSGTYGTCQYSSCSITISSAVIVNLDLVPVTSPGTCTIESGIVQVLTDDSNGFSLTLNDSTTGTALTNGAASISAESGTFASPSSLQSDTWGYRVDATSINVNSFGAGPTSVEANSLAPSATPLFAAIKASNVTADTITNDPAAADPAVNTTVFYGVCGDTSVTPGEYSASVVYSATTN
jgi:hypothetical protein